MLPAMSKYAGEEVLVVPRALFEETGVFHGLRTEGVEDAMDRLLDPENHFFMDRAAAEEDPTHKQLIAYCVIRHGDRILHYTRGSSGGESRLHAKISVGVGGHINPVDTGDGRTGAAAYHAAVARELAEELHLNGGYTESIIALINDDSNPVGQVHLGVVHLIELENGDVLAGEDALSELTFSTLEELRGPLFERLETWSQHCIEHLAAAK
jgi:predicted NUDIX family phosphoesterase